MRGPDFREFLGVRQFQGGQRTSCHQIKKGVETSIILVSKPMTFVGNL